jgi:uncharacterized protein (DUF488 family)
MLRLNDGLGLIVQCSETAKLPSASSQPLTLPMKPTALYTLGYEGLEVAAFIGLLRTADVRTVVDVRELPLSRKKGFSKTVFSEALGAAGIAYLHMPTLGCPKEVRDAYKRDGDWARYTRGFMKHLLEQEACVRELAKIAGGTTACLVCFEADFSACHRTYVGRAAQRAGAPQLKHLTARTVFVDQALRAVA